MLPPIICDSSDIANKDDASDGANPLVADANACAKPFVPPRAALEGALFTIIICIEPNIVH